MGITYLTIIIQKEEIYMKLLVPIDGSNASINAVKKSIEIARKYDFSIKIISVVSSAYAAKFKRNEKLWHLFESEEIKDEELPDEFASLIKDNDAYAKELEKQIKENSVRMLDLIVTKLDFSNIKVEKEVLLGEPYEKILEIAKNENFDLIVMGNRGFSKIKRYD